MRFDLLNTTIFTSRLQVIYRVALSVLSSLGIPNINTKAGGLYALSRSEV